MRKSGDRLRHTIGYEVILLIIFIPVGGLILNKSFADMGWMGISLSGIAMIWNYIYNFIFDRVLISLGRVTYERGFFLRLLHAILFEGGLMIASIPMIMAIMNYSFLQALVLDVGFLIIVPIYTFLYNFAYDYIFPEKRVATEEI